VIPYHRRWFQVDLWTGSTIRTKGCGIWSNEPITMKLSLALIGFLAPGTANAFVAPYRHSVSTSSLKDLRQLSDIDEMCIENVAELCLRTDIAVDGCDLEENEALKNQIKAQRELLAQHVDRVVEHIAKMDTLVDRMEGRNVHVEEDSYIPG